MFSVYYNYLRKIILFNLYSNPMRQVVPLLHVIGKEAKGHGKFFLQVAKATQEANSDSELK